MGDGVGHGEVITVAVDVEHLEGGVERSVAEADVAIEVGHLARGARDGGQRIGVVEPDAEHCSYAGKLCGRVRARMPREEWG